MNFFEFGAKTFSDTFDNAPFVIENGEPIRVHYILITVNGTPLTDVNIESADGSEIIVGPIQFLGRAAWTDGIHWIADKGLRFTATGGTPSGVRLSLVYSQAGS